MQQGMIFGGFGFGKFRQTRKAKREGIAGRVVIGLVFTLTFSFATPAWSGGEFSPKFSTAKIRVGSKELVVEVAKTHEEASYGLMYRKHLKENEGMLFIFADEEPLSFWMKNTFVDLSIAFFDKQFVLIEIKDMKSVKSEMQVQFDSHTSVKPAQYALEMRLGWFKKNNIKVGDKLNIFSKN